MINFCIKCEYKKPLLILRSDLLTENEIRKLVQC